VQKVKAVEEPRSSESLCMPRKPRESTARGRLNVIVDLDVSADLDAARADLKRDGVAVSISSLVEVAIKEFLKRRDLAEVLRKHHATARREVS